MPSVSEKQRRFMGADLARAKAGKKTRTGMSKEQLRHFAEKPIAHALSGTRLHYIGTVSELHYLKMLPKEDMAFARAVRGYVKQVGGKVSPMRAMDRARVGLRKVVNKAHLKGAIDLALGTNAQRVY
jgi:hypothetical protein